MASDSLIECVAIAICPWYEGRKDTTAKPHQIWSELASDLQRAYRAQAKAAIEAVRVGDIIENDIKHQAQTRESGAKVNE